MENSQDNEFSFQIENFISDELKKICNCEEEFTQEHILFLQFIYEKLLDLEFLASDAGINFLASIRHLFDLPSSEADFENYKKSYLSSQKSKNAGKNASVLNLNYKRLQFSKLFEKSEGETDNSELDSYLQAFSTEGLRYTLYKLLLIGAVYSRSTSTREVYFFHWLRKKINLDIVKCYQISRALSFSANNVDVKDRRIEGENYLLALDLEFALLDGEVDQYEFAVLEAELEDHFLDISLKNTYDLYLENSNFINDKMFKKPVPGNNLKFFKAMSFHLSNFTSVTQKCSDYIGESGIQEDDEYLSLMDESKFSDKLKNMGALEKTQMLLSAFTSIEGDVTTGLFEAFFKPAVANIKFNNYDESVAALMHISEYILLTHGKVKHNIAKLLELIVDSLDLKDYIRTYYFVQVYHLITGYEKIKMNKAIIQSFVQILKVQQISGDNLARMITAKDTRAYFRNITYYWLAKKMIETKSEHLASLGQLNIGDYNEELSDDLKKTIVYNLLYLVGFSHLNMYGDQNVTHIKLSKGQEDLFNNILDQLDFDQKVLRRIIFKVSLNLGVLFEYGGRLDYTNFR